VGKGALTANMSGNNLWYL